MTIASYDRNRVVELLIADIPKDPFHGAEGDAIRVELQRMMEELEAATQIGEEERAKREAAIRARRRELFDLKLDRREAERVAKKRSDRAAAEYAAEHGFVLLFQKRYLEMTKGGIVLTGPTEDITEHVMSRLQGGRDDTERTAQTGS
ncbi:MAG: OmpH family outer membrane protein [Myxococcota bacterium]